MKIYLLKNKCKREQLSLSGFDNNSDSFSHYHLRVQNAITHTNHVFEEVEVKKGSIILEIGKESHELSTGEKILIPAGTMQQWRNVSTDGAADCVLAFKNLQDSDLFEDSLCHRMLKTKIFGHALKAEAIFTICESKPRTKMTSKINKNVFIKTILKYLEAYKRTILQGILSEKIITSKNAKHIT